MRLLTRADRREEIIELFERISHCRRLVLLALVMSESLGRRGLNRYVDGLLVSFLVKAVKPVQCLTLLLLCTPQLRSLDPLRRVQCYVRFLQKLRVVFPFCEGNFLLQIDKRAPC